MSALLRDLLELENFVSDNDAYVFEAELWDKYGKVQTLEAIQSGLLEHRRLKFRDGYGRCVCWLSEKGRSYAQSEDKIVDVLAN
jgi:hypothetical protein